MEMDSLGGPQLCASALGHCVEAPCTQRCCVDTRGPCSDRSVPLGETSMKSQFLQHAKEEGLWSDPGYPLAALSGESGACEFFMGLKANV